MNETRFHESKQMLLNPTEFIFSFVIFQIFFNCLLILFNFSYSQIKTYTTSTMQARNKKIARYIFVQLTIEHSHYQCTQNMKMVSWQDYLSECLSKTLNIIASVLVKLLQLWGWFTILKYCLVRLLCFVFHSKSRCRWLAMFKKIKYRGPEMIGQFLFARGWNILWEEYYGEISKVEECLFRQKKQPTVAFWFQEGREQCTVVFLLQLKRREHLEFDKCIIKSRF